MKLHSGNGLWRQPAAISVHMLISCVLTPRCEPSPQLKYLHIPDSFEWADQTIHYLFSCSALSGCFKKETHSQGRFQFGLEKQPPSPLSFLPFLSSIRSHLPSVWPGFIYKLRNCRGGDVWRDGKRVLKREDSVAPVCCLKREHTTLLFPLYLTLFSFRMFSLFLSFLKSSSASLWAGFKDSKCEESNSVWVNATDSNLHTHTQISLLLLSAGSMFFVLFSAVTVLFLYTITQSQHWLWGALMEKKMRIQSEWLDSSYLSRLRLVTELDLTFFSKDSVSSSFFPLTPSPSIIQSFLI